MIQKIPVPITFNLQKHHFNFLREQIDVWKKMEWKAIEPELMNIGNNLLDFYIGFLTIEEICNECLKYFQEERIIKKEDFLKWLQPHGYKIIELTDKSKWIIKEGIDNERFIHIHPAKYSPNSMRVRATTLKTVVALQIHSFPIYQEKKENLQIVNMVRVKYLHLSPVRSLNESKAIINLWKFFNK